MAGKRKQLRVGLTGASGFLGQQVLACLQRLPVQVWATTRGATDLMATPVGTTWVNMDIASPGDDAYERLGRCEVLIHLAWGGLPAYRSLHHFEEELPRQFRFLRGLLQAGLPHLLVAGTCFEYGDVSGCLSESVVTQPTTTYGFAKDCLRKQLQFLGESLSFNLCWARLFFLFGPGQGEKSLYSQFRKAIMRGDASFPMSGGEQLRDFLAVSQAADLLVKLALMRSNAGVVNVCSGKPISVRRLVESWVAQESATIQLDLGRFPYPDYEPMAFWGCRHYLDSLLH